MTSSNSSKDLQQKLEAEYPLLDTSLLAAFISDLPPTTQSTDKSFQELRETLSQLSLDAEAHQQQDETDARALQESAYGTETASAAQHEYARASENSGSASDDNSLISSGTNTSMSSATSSSTRSPLEFLRILFPHLSITVIRKALHERNTFDGSLNHPVDHGLDEAVDMSALVDDLLTLEYIQDLTERGLEVLSDNESDSTAVWQKATSRKKHTLNPPKPTKRSYARPVPLVDVRQRQHIIREMAVTSAVVSSRSALNDPWNRLASLAARLSDLLHPTPPGFFLSYFHSSKSKEPTENSGWKTEGDALRDALSDIVSNSPFTDQQAKLNSCVEAVREILLNSDSEESFALDAKNLAKLEADILLCATAAGGESVTTLDLVWLLRELDATFEQGDGIAHLLSPPVVETPLSDLVDPNRLATSPWSARPTSSSPIAPKPPVSVLPTQPPPVPPPPLSQKHPPLASTSKKNMGWTVVGPRRPVKSTHTHAEFIPAYSHRGALRQSVKGSGNRFGKAGKGDVRELTLSAEWYMERVGDLQFRRNEALREASRHWQSGNAKKRGGEVAFYYAEKARELQEQQRKWTLDAARAMVQQKRLKSNEYDTLDLHGLTVAEACIIVKEVVDASRPSSAQPLKIITGRGRHSIGQVGVLGPAVRDMLRSEGFHIGRWDGGLIVR